MNHLLVQAMVCLMAVTGTVAHAQQREEENIKTEDVTYTDHGTKLHSYVAWDADKKGKRPVVVVVPEWWGNNDYAKMRARMLADLGYIAIAADMYGDGKMADNPQKAQEYATPFYQNPELGKQRIEAAIARVKQYKEADPTKIAAVGYCFGGSMVLNAIKLGTNLKGVVSFHGGLATAPAKKGIKGKILVCHGAADKFVPETDVTNFKKDLETNSITYKFISYPDATHAFTNPNATETGRKFNIPIAYNEAADKKSWADMMAFLKEIF